MNYFYFDSSVLVKRYYKELGTNFVEKLCQKEDNVIFISDIAIAELGAAFARLQREGNITEDKYTAILNDFMNDYFNEYLKVNISFKILTLATRLTKKNSLRAYDAIQLACAVNAREIIASKEPKSNIAFVVADNILEKSAQAEGFITINPNLV